MRKCAIVLADWSLTGCHTQRRCVDIRVWTTPANNVCCMKHSIVVHHRYKTDRLLAGPKLARKSRSSCTPNSQSSHLGVVTNNLRLLSFGHIDQNVCIHSSRSSLSAHPFEVCYSIACITNTTALLWAYSRQAHFLLWYKPHVIKVPICTCRDCITAKF